MIQGTPVDQKSPKLTSSTSFYSAPTPNARYSTFRIFPIPQTRQVSYVPKWTTYGLDQMGSIGLARIPAIPSTGSSSVATKLLTATKSLRPSFLPYKQPCSTLLHHPHHQLRPRHPYRLHPRDLCHWHLPLHPREQMAMFNTPSQIPPSLAGQLQSLSSLVSSLSLQHVC